MGRAALEHLHLESCGLGPRCSADLASIIHALCHTLKSIKHPGNSLDAAGVTLLAPALRECAAHVAAVAGEPALEPALLKAGGWVEAGDGRRAVGGGRRAGGR